MSKIKFLLALCLLMPAYAKAETWNCIFNDISGEKVPIIYTEVRGQYYVDLGEAEAAVVKTFEDDKFLHLVLSNILLESRFFCDLSIICQTVGVIFNT